MIKNIIIKKTFLENKYKNINDKIILGFWIYIISDCILFASLFSVYIVLMNNKLEYLLIENIFNFKKIFIETLTLLLSALTYGLAMSKIEFNSINNIKNMIKWLFITFLLGFFFLIIEFNELVNLIKNNLGPNYNAYMSSFFSILVTHGLHVFFGLIWILIIIIQINKYGLTLINKTRLICLSLFWHFLDIIWICVFTIIYFLSYIK
ncbi:MAG: cytochrome c oxidase subunit 3 [Enterobacteriaceae bacterium PSpyr]|nr:MAG: cytochrome c oxidase subunit 3 [Enterobacteriaceae bacterium PSpyr]